MFDCQLHFTINDSRMPRVRNCTLHVQLNDALVSMININPNKIFTHKTSTDMLETILLELGRRNLMNTSSARIPTAACTEIFELIRDYPCIKTLADQLSLDCFFNLSSLFRTSYCKPRFNIFFSIHA